jgi:transposase
MKVTGKLAKTDRTDAQILARFAAAVGPKPSAIPSEEARPLQGILTLRRQRSGMLVAAKNRLIMAPSRASRSLPRYTHPRVDALLLSSLVSHTRLPLVFGLCCQIS